MDSNCFKGDDTIVPAVRGKRKLFDKSPVDVWTHFSNTQTSDFKIICRQNETATDQQKVFEVHAFILKKYDVFDAMLDAGMTEQREKQMIIAGWNSQVVEKFIQFLYNDWVNDIESVAEDLLKLAHKYMVVRLMDICGEVIVLKGKNTAEAIAIFDLSVKYDVSSLKIKCQREMPAHVSKFSEEQLTHVLIHGVTLRVLADACEKQLAKKIDEENVFEIFFLARKHACLFLYDSALAFIKENWEDLRQSNAAEVLEFSKWRAESFLTGNLGLNLVHVDTTICTSCTKASRLGEKRDCGYVRCTGCPHRAHGSVCALNCEKPYDIYCEARNKSVTVRRCGCTMRYEDGKFSFHK